MRYVILPNRTPPGQVAMRLLIDAGSMQERPGEEGVAHFLEHLAFRGTAKYPDGEVQRALEGIGLQMAADVNASTGPDTTTFIIDLPRNDQVSLDTGLSVMRELVTSMLIEPDKVDAERGVVLAEERSRAGPALEASKAFLQLQLGNHPYGRSPIGLRNIIETVTPATIRGFYDAFYRPERATLIIVGDVRIDQMTAAITGAFPGLARPWRTRQGPQADHGQACVARCRDHHHSRRHRHQPDAALVRTLYRTPPHQGRTPPRAG
jgi:zinc protease